MGFKMKKLMYLLPILLCASNSSAKHFGSGFAWGSFAGFTTGMIAKRYQPHTPPSLYVVHHQSRPQYSAIVSQPVPVQQVVYQQQPAQLNQITQTRIIKEEQPNCNTCYECKVEAKQLKLEKLREQNKKKELALKEKELDIQILKLKQV